MKERNRRPQKGAINGQPAVLDVSFVDRVRNMAGLLSRRTPAQKPYLPKLGMVANAKKIKAKTHLDFLLELFTAELEERELKRRNAYQRAALKNVVICNEEL